MHNRANLRHAHNGRQDWFPARRYNVMAVTLLLLMGTGLRPSVAQNNNASESAASLSPTGRIVFASNRDGGPYRLWMIQADGTGLRKLLDHPHPDEQDVDPVFSADGRFIIFSSTRGGKPGIWRITAEGTNLERLCAGDQGELSPDGKRLVFRRDNKIWVRQIETGEEKKIVPDNFAICSTPSWDPQGTQIVFACRWEAGNSIWVVSAEGGTPRKVYDRKPACGPAWSPDGSRIAYETETHVGTICPDGTGNRLITFFGGVQRFPRWSPEGRYLVYCQGVSEKGPWELYIIPSTGGTPMRLTEGGSDLNPDWK